MKTVDKLIKRYNEDKEFNNITNKFYKIISDSELEITDFICAVRLAEYKNALYQSGEG